MMRVWLALLLCMLAPLAGQAQEAAQPGYELRIVEANLNGSLDDVVKARDDLQAEITALAAREGVNVQFYTYPNPPMAGAPVLLLESPAEFLPRVRELPGYVRDYPAPAAPGAQE